ncbi:MAG: hypothetical protein WC889_10265 [Myxococcota bacterium]|jgi:uncharacterized membrane protein
MLKVDIIVFAVAALGGLLLMARRVSGKDRPLPFALGHGLFAASGLVLLAYIFMAQPARAEMIKLPLILFVFTAMGGFFLFSYRLRRKEFPVAAGTVHGMLAVASFLTLLFKNI